MGSNEKFDALLGTVIDERYKLISVVGVGGMSVVFKASDLQDNNKIVALKLLSDSSDANSHAVKCFINESRAISMLDHENIIKVYDMSLSGDVSLFSILSPTERIQHFFDYILYFDFRKDEKSTCFIGF